jgi:2-polyprenyl-6-methoxyphenol hydroxylase-like FAD-dependent oxidoreductase
MGYSMAKVERILIVGGGIAGLTAAIALRQRGFSPELIEHAPAWQAVGAGIALQPNAMRLLVSLGVGTAVERAGAPLRRFRYCTLQGDTLAEIDLIQLWKDVGRGVGVERGELQDALLSELRGAPCRLGAGITSLEQKSGCVSVCFNDGRSENYDLVRRRDPALGRLTRLRERFAAFGGLVKAYLANLECDEQIHVQFSKSPSRPERL